MNFEQQNKSNLVHFHKFFERIQIIEVCGLGDLSLTDKKVYVLEWLIEKLFTRQNGNYLEQSFMANDNTLALANLLQICHSLMCGLTDFRNTL